MSNIAQVVRSPGAIVLSLAFGTYTFHYFALTGLFPTLLIDQLGLSIASAGVISALTVLANGVGNLIAGMLLKRGIPLWAIALFGYVVIGVSGFAIFAPGLPVLAIAIVDVGDAGAHGLHSGLDVRRRAACRTERRFARRHHRLHHEWQQSRAAGRPGGARRLRAALRLGECAVSVYRRDDRRACDLAWHYGRCCAPQNKTGGTSRRFEIIEHATRVTCS